MFNQVFKRLVFVDYLVGFLAVLGVVFALVWFSRSKEFVMVDLATEYEQWAPPFYWYSNAIKVGDKGFNEFGSEVAEVVSVENIDYGGERRFLRTRIKLEAIKDKRTGLYRYGNQRLKLGEELSITIGNVGLSAIIVDLNSESDLESTSAWDGEKKYMTVKVLARNIYSWLAESYNSDFYIKDEQGEILLEILQVLSVKNSSPDVIVDANRITTRDSQLFQDVELLVKIKVTCSNEVCFFNRNYPIRLGSGIWAHTPQSSLPYSLITEVVEEE